MQKNDSEKLWTRGFFLIWQGQLISTLGDSAYSIALGFWVLQVTGSTALMGTLMAVSALPGILVSPFAGVWIDRTNKKAILILMDVFRGISMVLIAAAAYANVIAVWMVFAAGILLSASGALFRPGVNSSIPELVPKSRLSNANSMLSIVSTGANMIGSVAGGFLYQTLGAPLLFLLNGISYFFSGGSLCFVKLPQKKSENRQDFLADMQAGFRFLWNRKGLRYLLLIASIVNFFSYISIVLFLPLFQTTSYLGAGLYGIAMAGFMGGAMAGFLILSIVKIPSRLRLQIFILSNIISNVCFVIGVNQHIFNIMIPFILIGGFFNSAVNVILLSTVQATTPADMRGKVLAFMSMTTQSMTPLAMAISGIIASFVPIRVIISVSFTIVIFIVSPFIFEKSFKQFISYDEKI